MKAFAVTAPPPAPFQEVELPDPVPEEHDLLVRIKAIAVNPVDYKIRKRRDPSATEPKILGWDAAGVVEAVGEKVTLFKVGDPVFYAGDITRQGCNAELQVIDERIVGPKPGNLGFEEAAALPLTTLTAWELLFHHLQIPLKKSPAPSILLIGGAGGVGSIATQLASRHAGLTTVATASRPETEAWCRENGADHVINHHEPFLPQLEKLGVGKVDYIACFNDTSGHWKEMVEAVKPLGRIGSIVDFETPPDLNLLKEKSVSFHWELMFTRAMFGTPDMAAQHEILSEAARLVETGTIKTTANTSLGKLSVENLAEAHRQLEDGSTIGKITMRV